MDLTFPGALDKVDRANTIAAWARLHKIQAYVQGTARSVMIRIHVPQLDIQKGFEYVDTDELNQCLDAVKELTDFANIIALTASIAGK